MRRLTGWTPRQSALAAGARGATEPSVRALLARMGRDLPPAKSVIMSNGGFGGLHGRLLGALQARQ